MKFSMPSQTAETLVYKIGMTLAHSLWLGLLLAVLAGLVLLLTKKSKPEVRYNLLTGLLFLFTIAVGFTFFLITPDSGSTETATHIVSKTVQSQETIHFAAKTYPDLRERLLSFLTEHTQAITLLWLLVIVVKTLQLGFGFYRLDYLRKRQVYAAGKEWDRVVAKFATEMGIPQTVAMLQSGLVKIPTVIGHFKPIILIPLGVITSIPADQVEMVLLHELAHIKRLDFFVNFIQNLTEILFFFNPAVFWVSFLIRKERENCCDDMALKYSGNKTTYIHALLSFREYQLNSPVYSVAFTGESGLVERAKRIAFQKNSGLKYSEKVALGVIIVLLFTFTVLFAQTKTQEIVSQISKKATQQLKQAAQNVNREDYLDVQKPVSNPSVKELLKSEAEGAQEPNSLIIKPDTLPKMQVMPLQSVLDPDTLQEVEHEPEQSLSPLLYKRAKLHYQSPLKTDSSVLNRLSLLRDGSAQLYNPQKLSLYQPTYKAYETKIKPFNFNELILKAMEKAGITIERNNIDYHITNQELTVNGIKQSAEVHQQVISAVLKNPTDTIDFTYGSHQ